MKYSSVDTSPVSKYVMHPFWNWLVEVYYQFVRHLVETFQ